MGDAFFSTHLPYALGCYPPPTIPFFILSMRWVGILDPACSFHFQHFRPIHKVVKRRRNFLQWIEWSSFFLFVAYS